MARPKKNNGEKPGKERIKDAFWELYQKKTLDNIGVKEIAALAGCNRTTFYYHYGNIEAILDEIENEVILTGGPQLLVNIRRTDGNFQKLMIYAKDNEEKIYKICHLLSSKGDPAFARKMKNAMLEEWRKALNLKEKNIPKETKIILEYFMGGSLSLLGSLRDDPEYSIEEIVALLSRLLSEDAFNALKNELIK